ncbi:Alpha/Beta hydrolase protein [Stachybotrys elegans]|uniref:Alpha/Beta hydrolase protein n=1 Tax=Stachybotrys elegans TaxID=80388 RepID=A0A8K0SFT1_9HYPO|nr:Alpha/Beta hydrolase protein [Stachybotrys elegans]
MPADIHPFQLHVPDEALVKLKEKLALATYFDEVDFSDDWGYGVPQSDLKRLVNYWRDGFDWRAQEAKINTLPQYTTTVEIDGFGPFEIHFVYEKSKQPNSIPLLFSHGWPGSFLEVEKILKPLTAPKSGPSFHVVAPSLPNFGPSQGASKPGFGAAQYAEAMHKVMLNLGYDRYVTQGGDWGFKITRTMGFLYPDHCLASHLNMVLARRPAFTTAPLQYLMDRLLPKTAGEKLGLQRSKWFNRDGMGYNNLMSTKPSTIGAALADSPVALLAWIYEKLHDWTDNYPWTDDEILTWVSIYQFSRAGPAANARIYFEIQSPSRKAPAPNTLDYNPKTKLGLSIFPQDIVMPPKLWGRTLGPVVFENRHADGGHFAAHERPELLVADLQAMFKENGPALSGIRFS